MEDIVQITNLKKSYRLGETTIEALKEINFRVRKGEFTAIIGASGSGKSTLLNMIGCIDDPDHGKVLIDNIDVLALDDFGKSRLRNEKIGFIFQSFNLVPVLTVFENIELPLMINRNISQTERNERVRVAAEDVCLGEYLKHLPDQLSGGQRQRVAIARALAGHPKLVLADEPTANLDSKTSEKIIDLMLELNRKRGVTFIFSTHDERLMAKVSRIVPIRDGVLVE